MIYILGSGYVARAYSKYFLINSIPHKLISRREVQYTDPLVLSKFIAENKPELLINAAGYVGQPNVDTCEDHKLACLYGNAILPGFIGEICQSNKVPWIHVSSGCIYDGSKRLRHVEPRPIDIANNPLVKAVVKRDIGFNFEGYTEEDAPNFTFRQNSSYYSGSKAMGEELLKNCENVWLCRLRIPFNEINDKRNYLTKLATYEKLINCSNSITQLDEFIISTFSLFLKGAPFGIYNVTNPGIATASEIVERLISAGIRKTEPTWINTAEFNSMVKTPRSNCLLDSKKICSIHPLTDVNEAIQQAISNWTPT